MTNTDKCPNCGALYAMVGLRHRCIPQDSSGSVSFSLPITPVSAMNRLTVEHVAGTYKYRDPEKWRAYMRDYMRKRRNG